MEENDKEGGTQRTNWEQETELNQHNKQRESETADMRGKRATRIEHK